MTQRSENSPSYPKWLSSRISSLDIGFVLSQNKRSQKRSAKPLQDFANGNKVSLGSTRSSYNSWNPKSKVGLSTSNDHDSVMISFAGKTGLADVSLKCMCTLLVEVTHFNFRANIISCIMGRLSRRGWDEARIFSNSTTAEYSPALRGPSSAIPPW